jgi:spore maturation protein CgeB
MTEAKNLLYIGVCAGSESMPKYFKRHFDNYQDFSPGNSIGQNINFEPDIIFLQLQGARHGNTNSVDICRHYRQRFPDAYMINWSGDKRDNTEKWYYEAAKHVNISTFSNMEDVYNLQKAGYNSTFLQIGIDPEIFTPNGNNNKGYDIVFLANNHGHFPLSRYRADIAKYLKNTYKNQFGLFGNGWRFGDGNLNGNEQMQRKEAALYRGSNIAISISNYNSERYTSDRLFRAMASGIMVLSHNYSGIEWDFEIGKHLDVFSDKHDLKEKIDYYLTNSNDREQIARQGCDYVHANYTLNNMINNIKDLAGYESN